jgi:hypothetical protein
MAVTRFYTSQNVPCTQIDPIRPAESANGTHNARQHFDKEAMIVSIPEKERNSLRIPLQI